MGSAHPTGVIVGRTGTDADQRIRQQVDATAAALKESRLDPGSPRAMALFGG